MVKIDLRNILTDLSEASVLNEDGTPVVLAKVFANFIANSGGSEAAKFMGWALALHKDGVIEVDETDKKKLLNFIDSNEKMTRLLKFKLTEAINED